MNKVDLAFDRLKTGYSCSQSVFSVFADDLGIDLETSLKVSSAFGGGIAGMGKTCGAVTGALMALGIKYGSAVASKNHEENEIIKYAEVFLDRIRSETGTVACRDILGVDLGIPEALKTAQEKNLFETNCPPYIVRVIRLADDILSGAVSPSA
jgi:C_GCAxxG_C_C family probable redox protein